MIQLIRGFKDILPGEIEVWQYIEQVATALFADYGFSEIRVPIMERTELFARSIGENTDIVEKEMYTFADRKGDLITLRPEATAAIVRSYIQHKMQTSDPVRKFYTIGPMFRRERPQKGRYRQFYQIDAEVFGIASPLIDAQMITMLVDLLARLEVADTQAHINSLGCPACRPGYTAALVAFLDDRTDVLCEDCRRRKTSNPLRVIDCKVPGCREAVADAPAFLDHLCADCADHFQAVRDGLDSTGTAYVIDRRLVRGLDYYTRTTYEIQTGRLGAQSAVAGGGRYDGLVKALGGPDMPATGFAVGFDRLAEIVGVSADALQRRPAVFIAALGATAQKRAFEWTTALARRGIIAEMDMADRSLKSQMKRADRLGARWVVMVGDDDLAAGEAPVRDMTTKEQIPMPLAELVEQMVGRAGAGK